MNLNERLSEVLLGKDFQQIISEIPKLSRSTETALTLGPGGLKRHPGSRKRVHVRTPADEPVIAHTHPEGLPIPSLQDIKSFLETDQPITSVFSGDKYTAISKPTHLSTSPSLMKYKKALKSGDPSNAVNTLQSLGFEVVTNWL